MLFAVVGTTAWVQPVAVHVGGVSPEVPTQVTSSTPKSPACTVPGIVCEYDDTVVEALSYDDPVR